eukprot:TRINITY_DN605_c0_g3_i1.p1 TRINITY_DN605_c0_g3~~TRINITY_DN605_c0_g3_i1.p1  ORF type:complete len:838 (-),score=162.20 TRINITY_DN605_c0_g3_i1:200-2713(-)
MAEPPPKSWAAYKRGVTCIIDSLAQFSILEEYLLPEIAQRAQHYVRLKPTPAECRLQIFFRMHATDENFLGGGKDASVFMATLNDQIVAVKFVKLQKDLHVCARFMFHAHFDPQPSTVPSILPLFAIGDAIFDEPKFGDEIGTFFAIMQKHDGILRYHIRKLSGLQRSHFVADSLHRLCHAHGVMKDVKPLAVLQMDPNFRNYGIVDGRLVLYDGGNCRYLTATSKDAEKLELHSEMKRFLRNMISWYFVKEGEPSNALALENNALQKEQERIIRRQDPAALSFLGLPEDMIKLFLSGFKEYDGFIENMQKAVVDYFESQNLPPPIVSPKVIRVMDVWRGFLDIAHPMIGPKQIHLGTPSSVKVLQVERSNSGHNSAILSFSTDRGELDVHDQIIGVFGFEFSIESKTTMKVILPRKFDASVVVRVSCRGDRILETVVEPPPRTGTSGSQSTSLMSSSSSISSLSDRQEQPSANVSSASSSSSSSQAVAASGGSNSASSVPNPLLEQFDNVSAMFKQLGQTGAQPADASPNAMPEAAPQEQDLVAGEADGAPQSSQSSQSVRKDTVRRKDKGAVDDHNKDDDLLGDLDRKGDDDEDEDDDDDDEGVSSHSRSSSSLTKKKQGRQNVRNAKTSAAASSKSLSKKTRYTTDSGRAKPRRGSSKRGKKVAASDSAVEEDSEVTKAQRRKPKRISARKKSEDNPGLPFQAPQVAVNPAGDADVPDHVRDVFDRLLQTMGPKAQVFAHCAKAFQLAVDTFAVEQTPSLRDFAVYPRIRVKKLVERLVGSITPKPKDIDEFGWAGSVFVSLGGSFWRLLFVSGGSHRTLFLGFFSVLFSGSSC